MTTDRKEILKRSFESFFNEEQINHLARGFCVCRRMRKIDPVQQVIAMTLAIP
jgi:hypothetical protein